MYFVSDVGVDLPWVKNDAELYVHALRYVAVHRRYCKVRRKLARVPFETARKSHLQS